jgi:aspartyl-tRNA(Asn)/glutamyl-tRNA(Gln) amidotransferase subunit C
MAITRDDVLHVARLARLDLSEAEVERMVHDLGRILGYVQDLSSVDTSGVAPMAWVAVEAAPLRTDRVEAGVERPLALRGAPRASDDSFAVPGFDEAG